MTNEKFHLEIDQGESVYFTVKNEKGEHNDVRYAPWEEVPDINYVQITANTITKLIIEVDKQLK
ncbi:MAG: hypothetical protein GY710_13750 [Desulfobacteraceae bacterium]|nr:hypothetical protein [Desulfobacteraceae bacterium]